MEKRQFRSYYVEPLANIRICVTDYEPEMRNSSSDFVPTLIFTHGLFLSPVVEQVCFPGVQSLLESLRHFRIIRYDTAGHGRSMFSQPAWDALAKSEIEKSKKSRASNREHSNAKTDLGLSSEDDACSLALHTCWAGLASLLLSLVPLLPGYEKARPLLFGGLSMGVGATLHAWAMHGEAALRANASNGVPSPYPFPFSGLILILPPTIWETRKALLKRYRAMADRLVELNSLDEFCDEYEKVMAAGKHLDFRATAHSVVSYLRLNTLPSVWTVLRGSALSDLAPKEVLRELRRQLHDAKRGDNNKNESSTDPIPFRTLIYAMRGDPVHPISSSTELVNIFSEKMFGHERLVDVFEFDRMHELESEDARMKIQRFAKL